MSAFKIWTLAGALAVALAAPALAADMPEAPPPPPAPVAGGWYLRGDIGFSNQRVDDLDNALYATVTDLDHVQKGFDSAGLAGVGVGYKFNDWFRADITGEYRSRANFHGYDTFNAPGPGEDEYTGSKYEWTGMLNGYVDLGTWYGVTPFVGAGVGISRNTIADFRDVNIAQTSVVSADDHSKVSFAWALQAGLAYAVTQNLSLELGYRYIHLGDAETSEQIAYNGFGGPQPKMEFKDISSNDIRVGMRWMLDAPPPPPPEAMAFPAEPACPGVCK